jgi:uncharacterized membrane protein
MPMGAFGLTALIVASAIVLVLAIVLVRSVAAARAERRGRHRRSALELLELRFAAGEITRRQLEERMQLLGVDPHIPFRFTRI